MPRSAPMEGSATPTIEMSRPSRNRAPQSTTSSSQVRPLQPWPSVTVVAGVEGEVLVVAGVPASVDEDMATIFMHVHRMHKHYFLKHRMHKNVLGCPP